MLTIIAAIAVGVVLLGPVLEICFIFCFTVAGLLEAKLWMPASVAIIARVLEAIGVLADALYQQTWGRYWFKEWGGWPWRQPGGWMFSGRVQWHIDNEPLGWRLDFAIQWADLLNAVVPEHDHIKRVEAARARQAGAELGDSAL